MCLLVTTKTGSKYLIDKQNHTWARIEKGQASGNLRAESGEFGLCMCSEGMPMLLICPPDEVTKAKMEEIRKQDEAAGIKAMYLPMRQVMTSPVVSVEELPDAGTAAN